MLTRDFLVRQIHQLTQVIAAVLFQKRAGHPDEAQQALAEGIEEALGYALSDLHALDREAVLDLCHQDGAFLAEKALALADLLHEDATQDGRERALWLYEAARDAGDLVPLGIDARISDLRASLQA